MMRALLKVVTLVLFAFTCLGTVEARKSAIKNVSVSGMPTAAKCDYMTDDTVAFQAYLNALPPKGGVLDLSGAVGTCVISGSLRIDKDVLLRCSAPRTACLNFTGTQSGITVSAGSFSLERAQLVATGAAYHTATGITYAPSLFGHQNQAVRDSFIQGFATGINNLSTFNYRITNTTISDFIGCGVSLSNATSSDAGDSSIDGEVIFAGGLTNGHNVGLCVTNTSGLVVANSKFIGEWAHVSLKPAENGIQIGPTGDYRFSGNSFEGHEQYGIEADGSAATIAKLQLIGNQFGTTLSKGGAHVIVGTNVTGTLITSNVFQGSTASGETAVLFRGAGGALGTREHLVDINQFYAIDRAIVVEDSHLIGLTIGGGNRYGQGPGWQVNTLFSGEENVGGLSSDKTIRSSAVFSNASQTEYANPFRAEGAGHVRVVTSGTVQGIGSGECVMEAVVSGASIKVLIANSCAGTPFSQQISYRAGSFYIGALFGGPNALYGNMEVEFRGRFSLVTRN